MVRESCGCVVRVSGGLRTLVKACAWHGRRFAALELRSRMVVRPVKREAAGLVQIVRTGGVRAEGPRAAARRAPEDLRKDEAEFRHKMIGIMLRTVARLRQAENRLTLMEASLRLVPASEPLTHPLENPPAANDIRELISQ